MPDNSEHFIIVKYNLYEIIFNVHPFTGGVKSEQVIAHGVFLLFFFRRFNVSVDFPSFCLFFIFKQNPGPNTIID